MSEKRVKLIRKQIRKNQRAVIQEFIKLIRTFTFTQRLIIALDIIKTRRKKDGN